MEAPSHRRSMGECPKPTIATLPWCGQIPRPSLSRLQPVSPRWRRFVTGSSGTRIYLDIGRMESKYTNMLCQYDVLVKLGDVGHAVLPRRRGRWKSGDAGFLG